ncbi:MAG: hypothetical protein GYB65_20650, partial [Chloroflexi bacterium]|nr:hypothetical protein [Chloroflexota bacterium]
DDTFGVDATWPLFIQQRTGLLLGYIATEGMEFETPDMFPDEVAAAGGVAAWMAGLDADPQQWARRLNLAQIEIEAMIPYQV